MSAISDSEKYLRSIGDQSRDDKKQALLRTLSEAKAAAVTVGDEKQANHIWCLEEAIKLQSAYLAAFAKLRKKDFYGAWCDLAHAEVTAGFLSRHLADPEDVFRTRFIEEAIEALQELFPYRQFLSPEFLEGERRCSICNQPVLPRTPCGHRVGELYSGEMCCIVVRPAAMLGLSLVENPRHKVNVVFLSDGLGGERRDHYDYAFIAAVTAQIPSPLTPWRIRWEASRLSHDSVGSIGRNDKCPCGSRKKYKQCCLREPGISATRAFLEFVTDTSDIRTVDVGGIFGEVPDTRKAISAGFHRNPRPARFEPRARR